MAQGLGHPGDRRFWVWAIPSYVVGAYMLLQIGRLLREEIWYRRLIRHNRSIWAARTPTPPTELEWE